MATLGNSTITTLSLLNALGVADGGTGAKTFTSGAALIGNGTGAFATRSITNNTSATAVTASTNLITANTLYYHKGNSNIVTVGTIKSGTWQGTAIANAYLANSKVTVAGKDISLGGSLSAADLKTALGLNNVSNTAASGYFTALSSNTTNAVSITIGGTTKNIAASTMKTSLGLGSLAYLSSISASSITQGYLNTHPENAPIVVPFIYNDLAFLNKKGGSYKVYKTTSTNYTAASLTETAVTLQSGDNMFDGSPSYATIADKGEFTAVIDMTLHKTFQWSNVFYIDFGAGQWRTKNIAVYVMNSKTETAYVLKQSITDNAKGNWYCELSHSSTNASSSTVQGFNKLRVVISGFATSNTTSGKRIAQIGLLNYGSAGVTETYISRGGCAGVYGSLVPHTTNSINLGSSSKKWANVYATTFNGNATSATKATQDGDGNVITTTYAKISDVSGLGVFAGMTLKTGVNRKTHSGWDNTANQDKIIPTMNFIAYWNGAYNASNVSNLTYCVKGEFGDAAIKAVTTSVTSGSTSLVTSGGVYTALASYLPLTGGTLAGTSQNTPLTIKGTASGNDAWIAFHNNSGFLASLGFSNDKKLKIYTNSTSYNVWTAANQGSGSGLDADKLDGNEASAFARANGTNASGTWRISISGNAATATTSSRLTALAPSDAGHTLYFFSGQPKIGTATGSAKEGSNAYNFYSYPSADATATNNGASANIISLRMQWGATYLHEIFASPNKRALWHRWINNNSPQPWSRIVLENNSSETETYNITVADSDKLGGQSASYYAAASSLASFLTLDGARTMTGAIKVAETKGILLRNTNTTYTAGIGYDTQGNECIAMWAKNSVTRLRWHAGKDMSSTTYQQMMSITPDFEISKADGTAKGYIGGSTIITAANIDSYIPDGSGNTVDLTNYVVKNGTSVQCIGGGLVVGSTSTTTAAAAGRIMITGHTNPLIGLIATGSSTPFYFQVTNDVVYLGPTSSVALSLDGSGNTTVRGTLTANKDVTTSGKYIGSLNNSLTIFGKAYNNSAAATIADTDIVSSVTEGTSDCTDNTEFLTSWASDNGFNDPNGKNKLYRRKMSKVYNYIKGKLDSVYPFYGVCDTADTTVAKTVEIDGFPSTLTAGLQVTIKFTNKSGVASATLNVNGTGAKPIYLYGTTAVSTGTTTSGWVKGAVQTFTYDGTGWVRDYWNNTTYSNVALGQGYATCSTAAATTAKTASLSSYALATGGIVSVKFTYDVPAGATLNINRKGAKAIYYNGAAITAGVIKAGDTATFIYNTYYHLISIDTTEKYAMMSITNDTISDINTPIFTSNRPFIVRIGSGTGNTPDGLDYGNIAHFGVSEKDTAFELFGDYRNAKLLYRSGLVPTSSSTDSTLYSRGWKTIAFTDSNVASATKLETARTIWGQSFDGTGNISGTLTSNNITPSTNNAYDLGSNTNQFRYLYCGWVGSKSGSTFQLGANNGYAMYVNTSQNVTIGNSDMAASDFKLFVNGSGHFNSDLGVSGSIFANGVNVQTAIQTKTGSTATLEPNVYYLWQSAISSLSINFNMPSNYDIINNYMFQFTASSSGCTLSLPEDIKWQNGSTPIITAGKTYQFSITNAGDDILLGVYTMFS